MKNPTRRNRNIGTAKQGYGQDNKLKIPQPAIEQKFFYERLGEYRKVKRIIKDHTFTFVVEETRENSFHACTIADIEKVMNYMPKEDFGELKLIILRQPTRKEENLSSVWGRLIYNYEFENDIKPAIIIEASDFNKTLKWSKKLDIDSQKELERLKDDGHQFIEGKRFHETELKLEMIRATQLYRTLLHEFGHYVHYLEVVERHNDDEGWEKRYDYYHDSLAKSEKEVFAHAYADELKKQLEEKEVIPFDRVLDTKEIKKLGLRINDFR